MKNNAVIATNRFGLGARQNEVELANEDPKDWLKKQLVPITFDITFDDNFPHSTEVLNKIKAERVLKKANDMKGIVAPKDRYFRDVYQNMCTNVLMKQIQSPHSISWRLFDFFSNHFSVTAQNRKMQGLSPTLEREVIGPLMLENFENMLLAVIKHPAMIIYLNNEKSIGPNSIRGKSKSKGLNENLAREILELHTLGVNGGYQQSDVIELAKAITGWSVAAGTKDTVLGFKFYQKHHEPGTRTVLGQQYKQTVKGDIHQGEKILSMLANHPSTAQHVCYKLAHHFISDNPSKALVEKMKSTWLATQGNIKAVMMTLIDAQESWHESSEKLKTLREFIVSTLRALQPSNIDEKWLWSSLKNMGQQPFQAGSPAGYSDNKQDWSGASALMTKIDWVAMLVKKERKAADTIMAKTFADTLSQRTYQHVMRAESRNQALALFLLSPEFLRR